MTKRAESLKALREMNDDELAEHLRQQRRRLFEIRFQQATGQVENHRLVREVRREIARTMTVQIEAAGVVTTWPIGAPAPVVEERAPKRRAKPAKGAAPEPAAVADEPVDEADEVDAVAGEVEAEAVVVEAAADEPQMASEAEAVDESEEEASDE